MLLLYKYPQFFGSYLSEQKKKVEPFENIQV